MSKHEDLPSALPQGAVMIAVLALLAGVARAQGSRADYARAMSVEARTRDTVFRDRVVPQWRDDGQRFWYRVATAPGEHEFILVDAQRGSRAPAFDHPQVAAALTRIAGRELAALSLPIDRLEFAADGSLLLRALDKWWRDDGAGGLREAPREAPVQAGLAPADTPRSQDGGAETELRFVNRSGRAVELFWLDGQGQRHGYGRLDVDAQRSQHTFAGHSWIVGTADGIDLVGVVAGDLATVLEIPEAPVASSRTARRGRDRQVGSPDGRFVASIEEHNVMLREVATGEVIALSSDGDGEDYYRAPLVWSPDGRTLGVIQETRGEERVIHQIESSPADQLQPKLRTQRYDKPGDRLPVPRPRLFDIERRCSVPIAAGLFDNAWSVSGLRFDADGQRLTFLFNQRGHQVLRIVAVDVATGAATAIVDERSATFLDYAGKSFLHHLDATREIVWMSERDGWNHLYLVDAVSGAVKHPMTRGPFPVRSVVRVDEQRRQVWFLAGGVRPGQDPYYLHLCRADLDGNGQVTVLTEGDGQHEVAFSPDRRFFIDRWSRVDQPPITELRRADDGALVVELERADWSRLLATGWQVPERFVAKGRDGATDIYGILIRPSGFDEAQRYPVVEQIYAGPHAAHVPKAFSRLVGQHAMAELGFVVVQIDGMGTSYRSKAFHDVCWQNLGDAGFPDRIAWIRAAAEVHRQLDLSRVGIYGGSAGGQNALRALLAHGDFYHVAVADCGCHDNRMDKVWWNELWMGWPIGPHYAEQSNVTHAHRLQGKLLMIVGEVDSNVDPASTLQVVNALIKADKDFDLLVMPGVNHGAAETPYGSRRRMDFLVRHLLQVEPRWE